MSDPSVSVRLDLSGNFTSGIERVRAAAESLARKLDLPRIDRTDPEEPGPQTWPGDQA